MGWEYHHRTRARNGQFSTGKGHNQVQLHLRLPLEHAEYLRNKARRHKMGLSEYCYKVAVSFYQLKGLYDRERRKNGDQRK